MYICFEECCQLTYDSQSSSCCVTSLNFCWNQSFIVVLESGCFEKFRKISWETSVVEFSFSKVTFDHQPHKDCNTLNFQSFLEQLFFELFFYFFMWIIISYTFSKKLRDLLLLEKHFEFFYEKLVLFEIP